MNCAVGVTALRLATAKDRAVVGNSCMLQSTTLQLLFITDHSLMRNGGFIKECIFNGRRYAGLRRCLVDLCSSKHDQWE